MGKRDEHQPICRRPDDKTRFCPDMDPLAKVMIDFAIETNGRSERNKSRPVVHHLLLKHFENESVYS